MSPDSAVTRAIRRVIVDSVRIAEDTIKAQGARALADQFRNVVQLAKERGKVAAFTETGVEGIPDSTWWTDRLLPTLKTDSTTRKLAYVLVWRNANERRKPGHHFAPYPGHASADDFVRFYMDPFTSFEEDLPDLYE
jgi:mannan endo-1,4-beta-mannosidase